MVKTPIWPPFIGPQDIDLKLTRTKKLLDALGNPEKKINNIIHIAGSNGKGSTTAFLKAFLRASGYSVNSYTSPHLVEFNERISLNGVDISDDKLERLSSRLHGTVEEYNLEVTFFEGTTVMAIQAFVDSPADFNIFEVGLGGRLDATNVFSDKLACLITPITYDHQEFLGDTIEEIAAEKGAIIQDKSKVFIGCQESAAEKLLIDIARRKKGEYWNYTEYADAIDLPVDLGLNGAHQKQNYRLAAQAFCELTQKDIPRDYKKYLSWPGRLQDITTLILDEGNNPNDISVYIDGGHNEHAAYALLDFIRDNKIEHVVVSMVKRKDLGKYLEILSKSDAKLYLTEITSSDESIKMDELSSKIRGLVQNTFKDSQNAIECLLQRNISGGILFSGSLFLVGEILDKYKNSVDENK